MIAEMEAADDSGNVSVVASMRPRSDDRGNPQDISLSYDGTNVLQ